MRLCAWDHRALSSVRAGLLGLALALVSAEASAQTEQERAGARVAAVEGHKAFFDQRWAEAIDLFGRAESLVHAPPHLLYIARAHEKLGHLVTAREAYMRIIKENITANSPRAFHDAQEAARQELPALEARIPYLTVKVTGADAGEKFALLVDGKEVASALVGLPVPVDPGEHTVAAMANGKSAPATRVELEESKRETIELALKSDPKAKLPGAEAQLPEQAQPTDPADATDAAPPSTSDPEADRDTSSEGGSGGMRIGSYAAFGVGALGLGAGILFTLQSSGKRADVLELCPDPSSCDESKRDDVETLNDEAGSAQGLATIGYVVGGVGIAAGVTLFFLSSSGGDERAPPTQTGLSVKPYVGLGSAGVIGRF